MSGKVKLTLSQLLALDDMFRVKNGDYWVSGSGPSATCRALVRKGLATYMGLGAVSGRRYRITAEGRTELRRRWEAP